MWLDSTSVTCMESPACTDYIDYCVSVFDNCGFCKALFSHGPRTVRHRKLEGKQCERAFEVKPNYKQHLSMMW